MSRLIDLTGQRFGRLVVIQKSWSSINKMTAWDCVCDCGNNHTVRADVLKRGISKSCGCLLKSQKNGLTHGATNTRLYRIWSGMIARCHRKTHHAYHRYGGRGIFIINAWRDFSNFKLWADANGYAQNLTIDRVDNNKGYCPENCRWATRKDQNSNKNNNVLIEYNGVAKTIPGWAAELGVNNQTLYWRVSNGWSIDRALTQPIGNNAGKK